MLSLFGLLLFLGALGDDAGRGLGAGRGQDRGDGHVAVDGLLVGLGDLGAGDAFLHDGLGAFLGLGVFTLFGLEGDLGRRGHGAARDARDAQGGLAAAVLQDHAVDRTGGDASLVQDRGGALVGGGNDVGSRAVGDDVDGLACFTQGHFGARVGAVGRHRRGLGGQCVQDAADGRGRGPRGGRGTVDGHGVFGCGAHDDRVAVRDGLVGGGGDEVVGTHAHARGTQGVARCGEEPGHVAAHAVHLDGDVAVRGTDGCGASAGHEEGRRSGDGDDGCAGGLNAHGAPDFVVSGSVTSAVSFTTRGVGLSRVGARNRTDTPTVTNLLPFREYF